MRPEYEGRGLACQENFGQTYGGQSGDNPETKRHAGSRTDNILFIVMFGRYLVEDLGKR
jgi:hypothetical protein